RRSTAPPIAVFARRSQRRFGVLVRAFDKTAYDRTGTRRIAAHGTFTAARGFAHFPTDDEGDIKGAIVAVFLPPFDNFLRPPRILWQGKVRIRLVDQLPPLGAHCRRLGRPVPILPAARLLRQ